MKKRIYCLLIGVLCLLMLAACGTQSGDNSGDNTDPQNTEVDILKEIDTANVNETLLSKYGKVAYRSTYTDADGTVESGYCYMDADRYVYETETYVYIDEDGDVYGFDDNEKKAFRYLFVDGSYDGFAANNVLLANFEYLGDIEKVVSKEEKDGVLTVTTTVEDADYLREYEGYYAYEDGVIASVKTVYEVDAETYEVITIRAYAIMADSTEKVAFENVRVDNPETYVVDEQLSALVNSEDKRTVTVIAHPGTENEKTYSASIGKGNAISVYLPEDSEQVLYADAECTTVYENNGDMDADMTAYYK